MSYTAFRLHHDAAVWQCEQEGSGGVAKEEDIELDEEEVSEQGRTPRALKDPGLPMKEEVGKHSTTHLRIRSWYPACVPSRASDRPRHAGGTRSLS